MAGPILSAWEKAKKTFLDDAGKKRPGDPAKAKGLKQFIEKYKSHTGLTPLAKTYDALLEKSDPLDKLEKMNGTARDKLLADIVKAGDALKTQAKTYLGVLKSEIEKEFKDGDTYGDVTKALLNLSNEVEIIVQMTKSRTKTLQGQIQGIKGGTGSQAGNAMLGILMQSSAAMLKAAAGMKIIVRNIRSKPTLENFADLMKGDPATRWAYVNYIGLIALDKKFPGLAKHLGAQPRMLADAIGDFGLEHDMKWWQNKIGDKDVTKTILRYADEIEKQIGNVERTAAKLKEFIAQYKD